MVDFKASEHGTVGAAPAPDQQPVSEVGVATAKSIKSPAFQFYPKDFLSSTKVQRMSLTEIGAYTILLSHCWLDNGLPTDLAQLARIVKTNAKQFARMWQGPLSECFHERGGRLHNDRMDDERRKQREFHRRQTDNGAKGGRPKKTHLKPIGFENETHSKPRVLESGERKQEIVFGEMDLDRAFVAFREAYPEARRKGGMLMEQAFMAAAAKAGGSAALMAALANHRASEQWQTPKLIPGMDTWLNEERWRQKLDPPGAPQAAVSVRPRPAWATPRVQG